jgi:cysteine desulfurase
MVGTIQPIQEIGNFLSKFNKRESAQKIYFHTDACQAAGYLDLDIQELKVDLLSFNGTKIYGPTGIGVLYKKNGIKIEPLTYGGGQEKKLRPGTENLPGIVGIAKALEIAQRDKQAEAKRLSNLRDKLIKGILEKISKVRLNGSLENRLPNNVNVSILDIEGEALLLMLDREGISASTGSACSSGDLKPSHVILSLGMSYEAAHGSLRLTLGRKTTEEDIQTVIGVLPGIVERLRAISPLNLSIASFGGKNEK